MALTEATNSGTSNSTTAVELITSPGTGERHISKTISIYNADTVAAAATVYYYDGSNSRTILKVTLSAGDQLVIDDVLVIDDENASIRLVLDDAVTTNQLPFTAHYGVAS